MKLWNKLKPYIDLLISQIYFVISDKVHGKKCIYNIKYMAYNNHPYESFMH